MSDIGYEDVKCHFCGGRNAGYSRSENGKDYDACMKCAKKTKKGDDNEGDSQQPRPQEPEVA